jgi:uncharacterized membrane protein YedE/YeeE
MIFEQYGPAIFGGLLIGLSASLMLLFNGRIAGVSGIFWRSITKRTDGSFLFILGLPIGAWLFHTLSGQTIPAPNGSFLMAALGGVLVGIGVKIGSGCTSGHGVCGISRLSKRSIVATGTFMATGILTVFVMRHLLT